MNNQFIKILPHEEVVEIVEKKIQEIESIQNENKELPKLPQLSILPKLQKMKLGDTIKISMQPFLFPPEDRDNIKVVTMRKVLRKNEYNTSVFVMEIPHQYKGKTYYNYDSLSDVAEYLIDNGLWVVLDK